MSRSRKSRLRLSASGPAVLAAPLPAPAAIATILPSSGSSSIGFAQTHDAHNFVPPLYRREQDQLTGLDLRTVHDKATRLVMENPYALGPIASVADYLGPAMPRAGTDDTEWNQIADQWFTEAYWDRGLWDASRKFTSPHAQRQMNIYSDTHGDVLNVFTHDAEGIPCIRMIPAPSIASPYEGGYGPNRVWRDGVKEGLHHRHIAWHVLADEDAPINLATFQRKGYIVNEADAVMIGNFKEGAARGFSRLIPTGSTIVQMQMYDNSTHDLLNLASKIGMSLETEGGQPAATNVKPIGGVLRGQTTSVPVNDAGTETTLRRYKEEFLSDGPAVISTAPGQKINLHNLDRDLPDLASLRGSDYERIAMCYGLPVTILFCIQSGLFNITGPNVRLALGRAKTWRDQELLKREPLIRRHYARVIQWGLDTRQIPQPRKDLRYWRCQIQWAKNYTIDEARDVSNDQKRLAMGATTPQEIAAEYGTSAAQNIKDQVAWVEDIYRRLEEKNLPTTLHFPGWSPPWQSAAAVPDKSAPAKIA